MRPMRFREARRAERGRAAPGRRRRVRAAAVAKRPWSRNREGGLQSASDTPSSHSSQGRAQPERAPRAHVVAQRGPERGEPGPKQVVAKERVRPAAGAPGRIHERHATLRDLVNEQGVDKALYASMVPLPSRYFSETTFCFIREDKPHLVAAALALGREKLIPGMFRQFLEQMRITEAQAPVFHYYLNRHVHLDEDFHGPLSMKLLEQLCGDDPQRIDEAETAAEEAICARIRFWDGVLDAIQAGRAS